MSEKISPNSSGKTSKEAKDNIKRLNELNIKITSKAFNGKSIGEADAKLNKRNTDDIVKASSGSINIAENTGYSSNSNSDVSYGTEGNFDKASSYKFITKKPSDTRTLNLTLLNKLDKQHENLLNSIKRTSDSLDRISQFQTTVQHNFYKSTLEHNSKVLTELQLIKQALYTGFAIDPNTGEKKKDEANNKEELSILRKLMFGDGVGGVKSALGNILNRGKNMVLNRTVDRIPGIDMLQSLTMANPEEIGAMLTAGIKTAATGKLKQIIAKKLGNGVGGLFLNPDETVRNLAKYSNSGYVKLLAELLNIDVGDSRDIRNRHNYEEDELNLYRRSHAPFDGKVYGAITKVIPDLLSAQLAVLRGSNDIQSFDYSKGEWISKEEHTNRSNKYGANDGVNIFKNYVKSKFSSERQSGKFSGTDTSSNINKQGFMYTVYKIIKDDNVVYDKLDRQTKITYNKIKSWFEPENNLKKYKNTIALYNDIIADVFIQEALGDYSKYLERGSNYVDTMSDTVGAIISNIRNNGGEGRLKNTVYQVIVNHLKILNLKINHNEVIIQTNVIMDIFKIMIAVNASEFSDIYKDVVANLNSTMGDEKKVTGDTSYYSSSTKGLSISTNMKTSALFNRSGSNNTKSSTSDTLNVNKSNIATDKDKLSRIVYMYENGISPKYIFRNNNSKIAYVTVALNEKGDWKFITTGDDGTPIKNSSNYKLGSFALPNKPINDVTMIQFMDAVTSELASTSNPVIYDTSGKVTDIFKEIYIDGNMKGIDRQDTVVNASNRDIYESMYSSKSNVNDEYNTSILHRDTANKVIASLRLEYGEIIHFVHKAVSETERTPGETDKSWVSKVRSKISSYANGKLEKISGIPKDRLDAYIKQMAILTGNDPENSELVRLYNDSSSKYKDKVDKDWDKSQQGTDFTNNNKVSKLIESVTSDKDFTNGLYKFLNDKTNGKANKEFTEWVMSAAIGASGMMTNDNIVTAATKTRIMKSIIKNSTELKDLMDAYDVEKNAESGKSREEIELARVKARDELVKKMSAGVAGSNIGSLVQAWMSNNLAGGSVLGFASNLALTGLFSTGFGKSLINGTGKIANWISNKLIGRDVMFTDANELANRINGKDFQGTEFKLSQEEMDDIEANKRYDEAIYNQNSGGSSSRTMGAAGGEIPGQYTGIKLTEELKNSSCAAEVLAKICQTSFNSDTFTPEFFLPEQYKFMDKNRIEKGTHISFFTNTVKKLGGISTMVIDNKNIINLSMSLSNNPLDRHSYIIALIPTDIRIGGVVINHFIAIKSSSKSSIEIYDPKLSGNTWKKYSYKEINSALGSVIKYVRINLAGAVNAYKNMKYNTGESGGINSEYMYNNTIKNKGEDADSYGMKSTDVLNHLQHQVNSGTSYRDIRINKGEAYDLLKNFQFQVTDPDQYAEILREIGNKAEDNATRTHAKAAYRLVKRMTADNWTMKDKFEDRVYRGQGKFGAALGAFKDTALDNIGKFGKFGKNTLAGVLGLIGAGLTTGLSGLGLYGATKVATPMLQSATEGVLSLAGVDTNNMETALGRDISAANIRNASLNRFARASVYGLGTGFTKSLTKEVAGWSTKELAEAGGKKVLRGMSNEAIETGVKSLFNVKGLNILTNGLAKFGTKLGSMLGKGFGKVLSKGNSVKLLQVVKDIIFNAAKKVSSEGAENVGKRGLMSVFKGGASLVGMIPGIGTALDQGIAITAATGYAIYAWNTAYNYFGYPDNSYCSTLQKLTAAVVKFILEYIQFLPGIALIGGMVLGTILGYAEPYLIEGVYNFLSLNGTNDSGYNGVTIDWGAIKSDEDILNRRREVSMKNLSRNREYKNTINAIQTNTGFTPVGVGSDAGFGYNILGGGAYGDGEIEVSNNDNSSLPGFVSQRDFDHISIGGVKAVFNGCALACAKMISDYYGKGISDKDLISVANKYILPSKDISISIFDALKAKPRSINHTWFNLINLGTSKMMTLLIVVNGSNHFINVYRDSSGYYIGDPMKSGWEKVTVDKIKSLSVKAYREFDNAKGLSSSVNNNVSGGGGIWSSWINSAKNTINNATRPIRRLFNYSTQADRDEQIKRYNLLSRGDKYKNTEPTQKVDPVNVNNDSYGEYDNLFSMGRSTSSEEQDRFINFMIDDLEGGHTPVIHSGENGALTIYGIKMDIIKDKYIVNPNSAPTDRLKNIAKLYNRRPELLEMRNLLVRSDGSGRWIYNKLRDIKRYMESRGLVPKLRKLAKLIYTKYYWKAYNLSNIKYNPILRLMEFNNLVHGRDSKILARAYRQLGYSNLGSLDSIKSFSNRMGTNSDNQFKFAVDSINAREIYGNMLYRKGAPKWWTNRLDKIHKFISDHTDGKIDTKSVAYNYVGKGTISESLLRSLINKLYTSLSSIFNTASIICGPYSLGAILLGSGAILLDNFVSKINQLINDNTISKEIGISGDILENIGFKLINDPKSIMEIDSKFKSGNIPSELDKNMVYMINGTKNGEKHWIGVQFINNRMYCYDSGSNSKISSNVSKDMDIQGIFMADVQIAVSMFNMLGGKSTISNYDTKSIKDIVRTTMSKVSGLDTTYRPAINTDSSKYKMSSTPAVNNIKGTDSHSSNLSNREIIDLLSQIVILLAKGNDINKENSLSHSNTLTSLIAAIQSKSGNTTNTINVNNSTSNVVPDSRIYPNISDIAKNWDRAPMGGGR